MYEELIKGTTAQLNEVYRAGMKAAESLKHNAAVQAATNPKSNLSWDLDFYIQYKFNPGCRDADFPCGDMDSAVEISAVSFRGIDIFDKLTEPELGEMEMYIYEEIEAGRMPERSE